MILVLRRIRLGAGGASSDADPALLQPLVHDADDQKRAQAREVDARNRREVWRHRHRVRRAEFDQVLRWWQMRQGARAEFPVGCLEPLDVDVEEVIDERLELVFGGEERLVGVAHPAVFRVVG